MSCTCDSVVAKLRVMSIKPDRYKSVEIALSATVAISTIICKVENLGLWDEVVGIWS